MPGQHIIPKLKDHTDLIIDGEIIVPGMTHTLRLNAGKIPSDNRINVIAHVLHSHLPGPALLVLGGVHGNEINGIEIVRRSIEDGIYASVTKGTVIIIPLLNVYGFINFSRDVADGKDVNRSFPGHTNGSLASRVARIVTKKILPHVDVAIDFHTGGDARYNYPQMRYNKNDLIASKMAAQCGVKYLVEQALIPHSFRKAAYDAKIPALVYEGGESIRLDHHSIVSGVQAIDQVLIALGMKEEKLNAVTSEQYIIHKTAWIRASTPGLFIWCKKSGDLVKKGDKLGEIKDPYGTKSINVLSSYSGHIIGHNNASVVSLGDALFHIGHIYTKV
ncbi:MAG: succinylglutamate desuccinylase/aspartoacylase family protein [Saprospiraceae bacterium]